MFWIHPVFQLGVTGLAVYVFALGWQRFLANHFSRPLAFKWQEHVRLGKYVCILWMIGLLGGLQVVRIAVGQNGGTGTHYWVAQLIMPCIAVVYITGTIMDRAKKKRPYLPLAHGVISMATLVLVCIQVATGLGLAWRHLSS